MNDLKNRLQHLKSIPLPSPAARQLRHLLDQVEHSGKHREWQDCSECGSGILLGEDCCKSCGARPCWPVQLVASGLWKIHSIVAVILTGSLAWLVLAPLRSVTGPLAWICGAASVILLVNAVQYWIDLVQAVRYAILKKGRH
jgi:hypothetical protein